MTGAPLLQTAVAATVRECAKAVCTTSPWKTIVATPVRNSDAARRIAVCLNGLLLRRVLIFIFHFLLSMRGGKDPSMQFEMGRSFRTGGEHTPSAVERSRAGSAYGLEVGEEATPWTRTMLWGIAEKKSTAGREGTLAWGNPDGAIHIRHREYNAGFDSVSTRIE